MKKKIFLIKICLVFVAAGCFTACNDTIENAAYRDSKGVSVVPNPMTVGQTVVVSGPGFKNATAVEFPGGVSVTDLTKAGDFQLSMIVPAGANSTGNIKVILPEGNFVIPVEITIVTPGVYNATAQEISKDGLYVVGPNDKLEIRGEGLSAVKSIGLPGVTIDAMDIRKSESLIVISVPMGVQKVKAKVQLLLHDGRTLSTKNEVDFSGEGYVPPELLLLCGRSYKIWSWDEDAPKGNPFGNGGFGTDKGPAWWTVGYGSLDGQFGQQGIGAKMAFYLPNKMALTLKNGTVLEGKFKVDVTQAIDKWSSGKLIITTGHDDLSILGGTKGTYNTEKDEAKGCEFYKMPAFVPKVFDIVVSNETDMVIAFKYPCEGTSNFYMYKMTEGDLGKVTVPDELIDWCGEGSKTWEWNVDQKGGFYGMCDAYKGKDPNDIEWWWQAKPDDNGPLLDNEGIGATMTFTYVGKGMQKLSKVKTNGDVAEGDFTVDMSAKRPGWSAAIGKLTTKKVTVLSGRDTGDPRKDISDFWILKMTGDELILGVIEYSGGKNDDFMPDEEKWGPATRWCFRAKPE